MPLSSKIIKERETPDKVMEFRPDKFPLEIKHVVSRFREVKGESSDFRMADALKEQTGLVEIEKKEQQEQIENATLERLKEVQESAYDQGYQLGLDEGKAKAYEEWNDKIADEMQRWDKLVESIERIKVDIFAANESHLIKTLTVMAEKLAMQEFEIHPEKVLGVISKAFELAQAEEDVIIRVCENELEFIERLRKEGLKESDPLRKVRLEGDADLNPGGCIIETNYGVVDATIRERVNKLWSLMEENVPYAREKFEDKE